MFEPSDLVIAVVLNATIMLDVERNLSCSDTGYVYKKDSSVLFVALLQ